MVKTELETSPEISKSLFPLKGEGIAKSITDIEKDFRGAANAEEGILRDRDKYLFAMANYPPRTIKSTRSWAEGFLLTNRAIREYATDQDIQMTPVPAITVKECFQDRQRKAVPQGRKMRSFESREGYYSYLRGIMEKDDPELIRGIERLSQKIQNRECFEMGSIDLYFTLKRHVLSQRK
ncbi:MAG: hypothetical protein Q7R51_01595 [bacterium]|nr:hypothetical protein [bacterium]